MKILPLAADSLGVRSMATWVETEDIKIIIDPGISLGPVRYGLPPHPKEIKTMQYLKKKIIEFLKKSEVVIITHYHLDHYMPEYPHLLRGKDIYIKNPFEKMSENQKRRGKEFINILKNHRIKYQIVDGVCIRYPFTSIEFSSPVFHGDPKQGTVIAVFITHRKTNFLYSSDVTGPTDTKILEFIRNKKPQILYLDGPNLPFLSPRETQESLKNLNELGIYAKRIIIDHHPLRDIKYREKLKEFFKLTQAQTVAEFLNTKENLLEAQREKLFSVDKTNPSLK